MKTWKIILLICFIPGYGTAQTSPNGFYQEIPYETLNHKIFIRAEVEGIKGKYLFDTGAPVCLTCSRMQKGTKKEAVFASDTARMGLNSRYATDMERDEQNIPYIMIGLSKELREQVMFDIGTSSFYEMNEPIYHKVADALGIVTLSKGNGVLSMGIGGMEKKSDKYRVRVDSMTLGTALFQNVITVTMNAFSSRIGTGLLEYGSVTLDFPGNKFYFVPNDTLPVDMGYKSWNVEVIASGDSLMAGFIGQSMAGQLQGGEKVAAINGKRYDKVNPAKALTTSLLRIEGEEAVITVIDKNGREKNLTIRKE